MPCRLPAHPDSWSYGEWLAPALVYTVNIESSTQRSLVQYRLRIAKLCGRDLTFGADRPRKVPSLLAVSACHATVATRIILVIVSMKMCSLHETQ